MDPRRLNFCSMSLACPIKFGRRSQIVSLSKNLLRTYCLSSSLNLWAKSCKKLLKLFATIMHFLRLLSMWFWMDTGVAKTSWKINFSMANACYFLHWAFFLSWSLAHLHEPMDGQYLNPWWKHQIQMWSYVNIVVHTHEL